MYLVLWSPRTSPYLTSLHFTSLQNKITSHKSRQFTPHHYTSHHFTYLHSIATRIPLLATTFLTLFLNVFNLHGKEASKLVSITSYHLTKLVDCTSKHQCGTCMISTKPNGYHISHQVLKTNLQPGKCIYVLLLYGS